MDSKKRKSVVLGVLFVLLTLLIVYTVWANTALELNTVSVTSERLPAAFDGFAIAQISDLHNASFGDNNERLLALLKEAEPDIIALTGDFIDSSKTDIATALLFAKEASIIAPCYFVTGNHEAYISDYAQLEAGLLDAGVTVLHDDGVLIEMGGERLALIGIDDPDFSGHGVAKALDSDSISKLSSGGAYTVLLSHRPECFKEYCDVGIDLVLSGHAHGGQFRLPFVGGLVAPNQGLFPKYDSGLYTNKSTNMLVSRGLGNSIIPLRINNRPEIVLITLCFSG